MSRDVLILVEHRDGQTDPALASLVASARELTRSTEGRVSGLLLCPPGAEIGKHLEESGLDVIHVAESQSFARYTPEGWARAALCAVRRLEPALFLCAHSFVGMEVAPFVAAAAGLPLLPNCLCLVGAGEDLLAERLTHGQAWRVRLRMAWRGSVVASLAASPSAPASPGGSEPPRLEQPRLERLQLDAASLAVRTSVVQETRPQSEAVDLERADVVVGAGRGIGESRNLALVEQLAAELGGVVACSRPLVDLGWMPRERLVGASGKTIGPKLYVACGISGAAQHRAGIAGARTVVAINRDAGAPIFRSADYGAVADLQSLLPELVAEARRRRRPAAGV